MANKNTKTTKTTFGNSDPQTVKLWADNVWLEAKRQTHFTNWEEVPRQPIPTASFTSKGIKKWNKQARVNQPIIIPNFREEAKQSLGKWFAKQLDKK